jgi:hypothetical protein
MAPGWPGASKVFNRSAPRIGFPLLPISNPRREERCVTGHRDTFAIEAHAPDVRPDEANDFAVLHMDARGNRRVRPGLIEERRLRKGARNAGGSPLPPRDDLVKARHSGCRRVRPVGCRRPSWLWPVGRLYSRRLDARLTLGPLRVEHHT